MRALIVGVALAALAACAAPAYIEGHRIRAVEGPGAGPALRADDLHAGAPAWFSDWWEKYLRQARRGYAVLALDRNGLGGWYVYCAPGRCQSLANPWSRSVKDVYYKHHALQLCRAEVAAAHPGARPDCALYAIRSNIVWQGPLPWEGAGSLAASTGARPALGSTYQTDGDGLEIGLFGLNFIFGIDP